MQNTYQFSTNNICLIFEEMLYKQNSNTYNSIVYKDNQSDDLFLVLGLGLVNLHTIIFKVKLG